MMRRSSLLTVRRAPRGRAATAPAPAALSAPSPSSLPRPTAAGHPTRAPLACLLLALTALACAGKDGAPAGSAGTAGAQPAAGAPAGATSGTPAGRRVMEFPVEVAPVAAQPVEYTINAVGSLEAFEVVAVTARVGGVVERVRFREGDAVATDTVLVEIEPERFGLAVTQAEATLARAEAETREAESGLARRQSVNEKNPALVREEDLETWQTRLAVARANAAQARAALELAKLNQRDALVRPPVAGVVQSRTVQTGQYVQPGSVLATLVRRDPLLLRFEVPEREAEPLRVGLVVRFALAAGGERYTARISHVAAAAKEGSRSVAVTALVEDSQKADLRPGAFAEVTVPIGNRGDAPVIPMTAVRPSERGFLAYVVDGNVARERVLDLGLRTAQGLVEVRSGLASGELLVVRGAEALRDGAQVKIAGGASESPPPTR
jgi:multidrug efflux system membrane fusion protein